MDFSIFDPQDNNGFQLIRVATILAYVLISSVMLPRQEFVVFSENHLVTGVRAKNIYENPIYLICNDKLHRLHTLLIVMALGYSR